MKFKTFLTSVFGLLLLVFSFANYAEALTSNEHQKVINTAYKYFNGAASGDQASV